MLVEVGLDALSFVAGEVVQYQNRAGYVRDLLAELLQELQEVRGVVARIELVVRHVLDSQADGARHAGGPVLRVRGVLVRVGLQRPRLLGAHPRRELGLVDVHESARVRVYEGRQDLENPVRLFILTI